MAALSIVFLFLKDLRENLFIDWLLLQWIHISTGVRGLERRT